MQTPASLLHTLAGAPAFDGCGPLSLGERCWLCAAPAPRGMLAGRWAGANFTDQDKARSPGSEHVCEPCCWACSWVQPPGMPPAAEGKKGLNLRLFSHLYDGRGYLALNKASKPAILRWLREPKQGAWFAAVADSGQKHTLPWTRVNPAGAGGVVRFEDRDVALPRAHNWLLVDDMAALLTQGVTKDEISTGRYSLLSAQHNTPLLRAFEHGLGGMRGCAWFDLALWLSQRNEEECNAIKADRAAKRGAAAEAARGAARSERRVPARRSKPAQALGSDPGPPARKRAPERDRRADADRAVPQPAPAGAEQFSLFEDPRPRR